MELLKFVYESYNENNGQILRINSNKNQLRITLNNGYTRSAYYEFTTKEVEEFVKWLQEHIEYNKKIN